MHSGLGDVGALGWIGLNLTQAFAQVDLSLGGDQIAAQSQSEFLPDALKTKLLVWTTAFFAVASLLRYLFGRLDWQLLHSAACRRCTLAIIYSEMAALLFDIGTGSSFFFLALLPLLSALKGEGYPLVDVTTSVLLFAALVIGLTGIGSMFSKLNPSHAKRSQPDSNFMTGLRLVGFSVSGMLLLRGDSIDAISRAVEALFGVALGDRLIASIGASTIRDSAILLISSVTISCCLRWTVPLALGSRPLALANLSRRQDALPSVKR